MAPTTLLANYAGRDISFRVKYQNDLLPTLAADSQKILKQRPILLYLRKHRSDLESQVLLDNDETEVLPDNDGTEVLPDNGKKFIMLDTRNLFNYAKIWFDIAKNEKGLDLLNVYGGRWENGRNCFCSTGCFGPGQNGTWNSVLIKSFVLKKPETKASSEASANVFSCDLEDEGFSSGNHTFAEKLKYEDHWEEAMVRSENVAERSYFANI